MPICQESVGAGVVGRQVAGWVATGRVTLVVQNLRRRHVYVLPARPPEAITQVDVLHVHEIALVEARHLIERGAPQQQARSGQPSDGAFAGLDSFLPVFGRPGIGFPERAHDRVHAAADQARQDGAPTGTPSRRGRGSTVPAPRPSATVRRRPATRRCCGVPTARRGWRPRKLGLRRDLRDSAVHARCHSPDCRRCAAAGHWDSASPLLPAHRPSNRCRP